MRISIFILMVFLIGCATVTWDGFIPGKKYQVSFIDSKELPVTGVTLHCIGNSIWPSTEMASDINNSSNPSNKNGRVKFSHKGFHFGGKYHQLGSFKWGESESPLVFCEFKYKGRLISSGELSEYNQLDTVVSINEI